MDRSFPEHSNYRENISVERIKVGERYRKDLGDIGSLVASIDKLGLLHPIVVNLGVEEPGKRSGSPTCYWVIAGFRRLEAVRKLGWKSIPVTIANNLSDAVEQLRAERDENICRQDLTPSEAVALGKRLEELERPKAQERKAEGQDRGRAKQHGKPVEEKFSPTKTDKGKTADKVAKAVGMSAPTYRKAKAVVEAAEKPDASDEIKEAKEEMDRTGKVDPAYRTVKVKIYKEPVVPITVDPVDPGARLTTSKAEGPLTPMTYKHLPPLRSKLFEEANDPIAKIVARVRKLGRTHQTKFWSEVTATAKKSGSLPASLIYRIWFYACCRHIPHLHLLEDGDEVELVFDEKTEDLCTLVRDRIDKAHKDMTEHNRFKFDVDMIKKMVQDLYDLVSLGAKPRKKGRSRAQGNARR